MKRKLMTSDKKSVWFSRTPTIRQLQLSLIQNFSVKTEDCAGVTFSCGQFFEANGLVLIILGVCVLWILLAIAYYVSFAAFKWSDVVSGYEIVNVEEQEGAGLNFFL